MTYDDDEHTDITGLCSVRLCLHRTDLRCLPFSFPSSPFRHALTLQDIRVDEQFGVDYMIISL